MRTIMICILNFLVSFSLSTAQEIIPPSRGGFIKSLGQPQIYKWYSGFSLGIYRPLDREQNTGSAQLKLGAYRDLVNPAIGLLGITVEGYFGAREVSPDGGIRVALKSPVLRLAGGMDYNIKDNQAHFILRVDHPVRRGGVFGHGTLVNIDWLPGRDHSFTVGVRVPIGQHNQGKTRPRQDHVTLTSPRPWLLSYVNEEPTLDEALANVRETAHWINRLTTPFFDQNGKNYEKAMENFVKHVKELKAHLASASPLFPNGRSSEAEIRIFHQELDRAFSIAASGKPLRAGESIPIGKMIAEKARAIILEEVILPYNRLLGQIKKKDTLGELTVRARGAGVRWLHTSGIVPPEQVTAVGYVFLELLTIIEENRKFSRKAWNDSRLVWLPLQYALRPEQYDSQAELDSIIERAVNVEFTKGNRIWYVINEQFQWELANMIRDTEDYHVLWIHDIAGRNAAGDPDELTFKHIINSYFAAMIQKIRDYDRTGKFPVYMIFIDQFFYEVNKSRSWLNVLENPLEYKPDLPRKFDYMKNAIVTAQEELKKAIAESKLLQLEVLQYGKAWLKNLIKVHMNVTNPADPTFWSQQVLPMLGMPDNIMRDHRKISFYDITEDNPYKGMAMFTGMGVGEYYAGPTWEDRAILTQGPALLALKYEARRLLLNQGFTEEEIPFPLVPKPKPANYSAMIQSGMNFNLDYTSAMQIHNQTGYRLKRINILKAILYNLMPKGALLKIPDSLWNSPFWAGMLVGSSLRGGRVFIIGPSLAGAPSAGYPQMSRAQELFARLIVIQEMLGEEIAAAGGMLKTGLYDPNIDVADLRGRTRSIRETFEKHPFLQKLYRFHPKTYDVLNHADELLDELGFEAEYLVSDVKTRKPKLHLKTQFFASKEAWENISTRPEMALLFREYLIQRARQLNNRGDYTDVRHLPRALNKISIPMWNAAFNEMSLEEQERMITYVLVGSHNMDYRGMMMDGEVMYVISGGLNGLIDFLVLTGLSTWIDDLEELEKLLPRYSEFKRRIGRFIKIAL